MTNKDPICNICGNFLSLHEKPCVSIKIIPEERFQELDQDLQIIGLRNKIKQIEKQIDELSEQLFKLHEDLNKNFIRR